MSNFILHFTWHVITYPCWYLSSSMLVKAVTVSRIHWKSMLMNDDLDFKALKANRPKKAEEHNSWWRHQMETFSALLAICTVNSLVTGEFPSQRPVTWSFGVFFDMRLNKRLSIQSWGWWLRRHHAHYSVIVMLCLTIITCRQITRIDDPRLLDLHG